MQEYIRMENLKGTKLSVRMDHFMFMNIVFTIQNFFITCSKDWMLCMYSLFFSISFFVFQGLILKNAFVNPLEKLEKISKEKAKKSLIWHYSEKIPWELFSMHFTEFPIPKAGMNNFFVSWNFQTWYLFGWLTEISQTVKVLPARYNKFNPH